MVNILNMRTFNEINKKSLNTLILKATKTEVCSYVKDEPPLRIFGELDTVTETKTKFLEAETKNINLLSGVIFLALGLMFFL